MAEAPNDLFRGWILFLCGICMGIADLVPGISGGTVAFIIGFYHPLLNAVQTFNTHALFLLLRGEWRAFSRHVAWKFLLTLFGGIAVAFICFAHLFHYILGHELYRVYLYAFFGGLIAASFVYCIRLVQEWSLGSLIGLVGGAVMAYLLTGATLAPAAETTPLHTTLVDGWLIICGAIAVCALLLPGISGSYMLTILGVYPTVIEAFVDFLSSVKQGSIHFESFAILFSLAMGIGFGAVSFSRLVSWLLKSYPNAILSVLSGFMIGAMRSVWPFWTYTYAVLPLKPEKGLQLVPAEPYVPLVDDPLLWSAAGIAVLGFALVIGLEWLEKALVKQRTLQPAFPESLSP